MLRGNSLKQTSSLEKWMDPQCWESPPTPFARFAMRLPSTGSTRIITYRTRRSCTQQAWRITLVSPPRYSLRISLHSLPRRSGSPRWGASRKLENTRPQLRCLRAYHLCRRRLPRARFVVRSRGNSLIYSLRRCNITKWPQKTSKHPKPSTKLVNKMPSLSPTWKFPGIPVLMARPRSPPSHPLGLAGLVCLAHRPNLRTDLS